MRGVQDPEGLALVVRSNLHDFYGSDGTDSEVPFRQERLPLLRLLLCCRASVAQLLLPGSGLQGGQSPGCLAAAACVEAPLSEDKLA